MVGRNTWRKDSWKQDLELHAIIALCGFCAAAQLGPMEPSRGLPLGERVIQASWLYTDAASPAYA
eukprot:2587241-Pleurochrysis_carterae.AAC.1